MRGLMELITRGNSFSDHFDPEKGPLSPETAIFGMLMLINQPVSVVRPHIGPEKESGSSGFLKSRGRFKRSPAHLL